MSGFQAISSRLAKTFSWSVAAVTLICVSAQAGWTAGSLTATPPAVTAPIQLSALPVPATDLPTNLKEMGETTAALKHALTGVMKEVNRHETVVVQDPYFDDPFLYDYNAAWNLSYPIPDDAIYSYNTGKLLPPREKWLNHFMDEVLSLLQILQNDVSAINLTPAQTALLGPQLEVMRDTLGTLQEQSKELQILTQVKDSDNNAINNKAQIMRDEVGGVDNLRKKFLQQVSKEIKQADG